MKKEFLRGLKDGYPIGLGYIPVSMAVGIGGIKCGMPFNLLEILSMLIYSGTGQLTAQNLYAAGETAVLMYAITLFIINCRYILFSISMAQKFGKSMGTLQRIIYGFFNTDEIYAIAMKQRGDLEAPYLFGLATIPYIGFLVGNTLGAVFTNLLPPSISSALNIMLYAMLIAMIVPPAKRSKPMFIVTLIALALSYVMECTGVKAYIQPGLIIVICAVVTALIGAVLFPVEEDEEEEEPANE